VNGDVLGRMILLPQHLGALPLKLVLLQVRVAVWSHRHWSRAGQEVDPVVVGAGGWQPAGLLEDVLELLQEAVQEGLGRRCEGRPDGWLGAPRRAHAQPRDVLATADEGHAVVRKVP
jgi:hypothetical protein